MNDKGFADRLDALLSEYDVDEQERILRYALDHIVPRMKGRATAEQPAEPKPVDHDVPGPKPGFPKTSRDWLAAIIDIDDDRQRFDEGDGQYVVGAYRDAIEEARKHLAATAPAPVAPTEPLFLVCAGGDVYQSEIVPQSHLEDAYLLTQWCSLDGIPEDQRTDALDRFRDPDEWECVDAQVGTGRVPVEFSVDFEDGWVRVVRLPSSYAPAAPVAEVLTALDAVDGTLHGAIDYWQNRALAAEAGRDADETNAVLASNYIALCARLESGAEVLADAQMEEGLNSYEWESVPHPFRTSVAFERGVRFAERAHGIAAMSAAPPVPTADSPDPHKDSAKALLSAAQEFFREGSRAGVQGAVRWVTYEDGSLVIFTRGEYLDTLLKNISDTGISSVHHFAAPPAPAKVLTDRDIDGLLHALNSHARHYGDEYGLPCDAPHELSHMRKLVRYHIAAMAASSAPEGRAT